MALFDLLTALLLSLGFGLIALLFYRIYENNAEIRKIIQEINEFFTFRY